MAKKNSVMMSSPIHDPDKVYPYMLSGIGVAFQEVLEREILFYKKMVR